MKIFFFEEAKMRYITDRNVTFLNHLQPLFIRTLHTPRTIQYHVKNLKQVNLMAFLGFLSIGFSNNTNSKTPTFKHSHIIIKLGD